MFRLLKMKVLISHGLRCFKGKFYNWDESQLQKIKVEKHQWCHGVLFNLVMSDDHVLLWSESNCQRQMCILRKGVVCDATVLAQLPETENTEGWVLSVLTEKQVLADMLLIRRAPEWDSGVTQYPAWVLWCSTQKCCSSVLHSSPRAVWCKYLLKAPFRTRISVIYYCVKISKALFKGEKNNTVECRLHGPFPGCIQ